MEDTLLMYLSYMYLVSFIKLSLSRTDTIIYTTREKVLATKIYTSATKVNFPFLILSFLMKNVCRPHIILSKI